MPSPYFLQRMAEIESERQASRLSLREEYERERKIAAEAARKRQKALGKQGYVYFLRAGNVVKIGFSTNLIERERSLRTARPENAFICKFVEGAPAKEREFHKRFAEYRLNGEWFDVRGKLAKYLEMHVRPVELPPRVKQPSHEAGSLAF